MRPGTTSSSTIGLRTSPGPGRPGRPAGHHRDEFRCGAQGARAGNGSSGADRIGSRWTGRDRREGTPAGPRRAEPRAPAQRRTRRRRRRRQPAAGRRGRVVANMTTSLTVPTATSVRAVPAKLMADNRVVINNHLRRARGGKISYTHLIGYAIVKALADNPEMNTHFAEIDGRPTLVTPEHVNLGIAIDLVGKDNARSLIVANIKRAETMSFAEFWSAYEDIIRRARSGKLSADDFAGTTITLTNPGTIGTNHSVPRLMEGQGTIIGVGAMEIRPSSAA